jgi:hypothetical protein
MDRIPLGKIKYLCLMTWRRVVSLLIFIILILTVLVANILTK